jgi:raffinose/stachyose/melibiose transport system substrate-binding protein
LEKYLELRQYGQANTVGTSYDDANADFLNQKALMMIEINSTIPSIDAGKPTFAYAMFPLPADNAADTKLISGIDTAYCISADCKNMAAADDFLTFMSSQKAAQQYADFDKSPSAIQGVKLNVKGTESLADLLGAGRAVGWVHDFYGSGAAPELERLAQKLAADKDIDAYLSALAGVIKDTAPNLAKFKK